MSNNLSFCETSKVYKFSGTAAELKQLCEDILQICKASLTQAEGANGDPFCCKIGNEINLRLFPSTRTFQVRGNDAEGIKEKFNRTY